MMRGLWTAGLDNQINQLNNQINLLNQNNAITNSNIAQNDANHNLQDGHYHNIPEGKSQDPLAIFLF